MNLPSGESFPVSLVYTKRVIDLKGDLFVGYMLLFSVVIGLVLTLLLTPLRLIVRKKGTEQQVPLMWIAGLALLFIIGIFGFYYITNLDRNPSSLWLIGLVVTAAGAFYQWDWSGRSKAYYFSYYCCSVFIWQPLFYLMQMRNSTCLKWSKSRNQSVRWDRNTCECTTAICSQ